MRNDARVGPDFPYRKQFCERFVNGACQCGRQTVQTEELAQQQEEAPEPLVEDEAFFSAVSGAWVVVPGGGGDENNLALYDAAIADLGLKRSSDPCSA